MCEFEWLNVLPFNRVLVATAFIVLGNIFLVAFGNHQSPGMLPGYVYFLFFSRNVEWNFNFNTHTCMKVFSEIRVRFSRANLFKCLLMDIRWCMINILLFSLYSRAVGGKIFQYSISSLPYSFDYSCCCASLPLQVITEIWPIVTSVKKYLHVLLTYEICRRGELLLALSGKDLSPYWFMLLPFSYAVVSGAVGSCSVLFAKSL